MNKSSWIMFFASLAVIFYVGHAHQVSKEEIVNLKLKQAMELKAIKVERDQLKAALEHELNKHNPPSENCCKDCSVPTLEIEQSTGYGMFDAQRDDRGEYVCPPGLVCEIRPVP